MPNNGTLKMGAIGLVLLTQLAAFAYGYGQIVNKVENLQEKINRMEIRIDQNFIRMWQHHNE